MKRAVAVLGVVCVCATAAAAHSSTVRTPSPLVGQWQTLETCQGLVVALTKFGLAALAPGVVNGYFPSQTPAQLAQKTDLCSGATPVLHSHFFARNGKWGSLDQNGDQVDNGSYRVLTPSTVKINDGRFRFRIQGKTLSLTPLITGTQKQAALAKPLDFSTAGWMVAVSYWGHPYRRVPCVSHC